MPKLGKIKSASELGYKNDGHKYMWRACVDCGKEDWSIIKGGDTAKHCRSCASKIRWGKERRPIHCQDGYILIRLEPTDFYYSMTDHRGYIREHRLVVAKALGRCLHSWEIVHHKHAKYLAGSIEDKQDNRFPENLQLISELGHRQLTILEKKLSMMEERIAILEEENRELRNQ